MRQRGELNLSRFLREEFGLLCFFLDPRFSITQEESYSLRQEQSDQLSKEQPVCFPGKWLSRKNFHVTATAEHYLSFQSGPFKEDEFLWISNQRRGQMTWGHGRASH